MKKVLIIGANGFLGSKLTKYLVEKDVSVVAFVPKGFDYSNISSLSGVNCVEFSFGSLGLLNYIAELDNVEMAYNMAWIGVNAKDRNNEELQLSNVKCNVEVVELLKRNGILRLIVPGSAAQYACSGRVIDGTGCPAPSDLYSAAKVATYYYCNTLCTLNGIELIWPLVTSIYGIGRDDDNLISYVIKSLLKGKKPQTTKLEQRWDYLYVADLLHAFYLLGEKGKGGRLYPVGSGESRTLYEYVEIIRDLINPALPLGIGELPYKNSQIDNQVLDITALKEDTGFEAKYSFIEGIKEEINFFKTNII